LMENRKKYLEEYREIEDKYKKEIKSCFIRFSHQLHSRDRSNPIHLLITVSPTAKYYCCFWCPSPKKDTTTYIIIIIE